VRGEGEETTPRLIRVLETGGKLLAVRGIAFRENGVVIGTQPASVITNLDGCRVGWELIDHRRYSYWGGKRAVVMQFSRRGFWTRFRHRDRRHLPPRSLASTASTASRSSILLMRTHPLRAKSWCAFLEALIAENVNLTSVGSTRADDIVRDADILHLYKRAGLERFLMGMENSDEATLRLIRKGGATAKDREAIRLLRQHDIPSMATWIVGFEEETERDLLCGLSQLLSYDPDQIQALYVTPHRRTPYFWIASDRRVMQIDQRRWDYKHQVLATRYMAPWRLIFWVKLIELVLQSRSRALWRLVAQRDPKIRHAIRWYYRMGRRVWFHEIWNFIYRDRRKKDDPTLTQFWGEPQDAEEESMIAKTREGPADRCDRAQLGLGRALRLVASKPVEEVL
jgi:anaerobic magnesium-protoporphyrin IX monomethyl ester cyclase